LPAPPSATAATPAIPHRDPVRRASGTQDRRALRGRLREPHARTTVSRGKMMNRSTRGAAKVSIVWTIVGVVLFVVALVMFFLTNQELGKQTDLTRKV